MDQKHISVPLWLGRDGSAADKVGIAYPTEGGVSCTLPLRGPDFDWIYVGLRLQFHDAANPRYSVEAVMYEVHSKSLSELTRVTALLKKVDKAVCKAYRAVTGYDGGGYMQISDQTLRPFLLAYWKALGVKSTVSCWPASMVEEPLDADFVVYTVEKAVRQVCESGRKDMAHWYGEAA